MNRAVGLLTAATFVSMVAGFAREVAIAFRFGATGDADALSLAMFYVDGIAAVAVVGIAGTMLVPVITRVMQTHGVDESFRVLDSCLSWAVLLMTPVLLAGFVAPAAVAQVLAPDFDAARLEVLAVLLQFAIPAIALVIVSGVMSGVLQANRDYFRPVHGRTLFALVIAIALVGFQEYGVAAAGAGLLIGAGGLVAVQVQGLARRGWRPRAPRLFHPTLRHALEVTVPTLLALALINVLMGGVQRMTASGLPPGALAAMNYALRALNIVAGLSVSLATVSLTELSHRYEAEGVGPGTLGILRESLETGLWLLVPLSALLVLGSEPLVGLLFHRGQYDMHALHETARCLRWLAGSVVPGMVVAILLRAAPAFGRPWRSVVMSAGWTIVTVVSTVALVPVLGAASLAAGQTIGVWVATVVSVLVLQDLVPVHSYRSTVRYGLWIAAISSVGIAAVEGILAAIGPQTSFGAVGNAGRLLIIGLTFAATAGLTAVATREPRTSRIIEALASRFSQLASPRGSAIL